MARKNRKRRAPVRFRLTVGGWLFLFVSVLLGISAVKSQVGLMFVIFGVMIGALHVSAVAARATVRGVDVRRDVPGRAWQYQAVPLGYHLRNTGRRACLSLALEEFGAEGVESVSGFCANLPGGTVFRAGGRFSARRRGRVVLREVRVSTTFPFGLVRAYKRVYMSASVVVWPARGRLRARLLHRGAVESSTAAPSRTTGGQDEFFGLREYRLGDSLRWIHWRRSAMRPTPVVREMARSLPEMLWVVVDARPGCGDEVASADRERRVRFATTLIDYAFSRGYQVGLAVGRGEQVAVQAAAPGRGHRRLLLDLLAEADAAPSVSPACLLSSLSRGLLAAAQVVLVVADADELRDAPVGELRAACRYLTVVSDGDLPRMFEDAAAAQQTGPADGESSRAQGESPGPAPAHPPNAEVA